jgi:predicted helicase
MVDGEEIRDKQMSAMQDDYVKFLRFAQWKIPKAGKGIVGMITNHSYIDNPTLRGMRQSLLKTFDEIYVLDLHGNSLKKEKCTDGSKDENVFDIMQGTAIILMIKESKPRLAYLTMNSMACVASSMTGWIPMPLIPKNSISLPQAHPSIYSALKQKVMNTI